MQVGRLKVVLPGVHCRHLRHDAGGATHCSVYARRFEVAPWCLSAEQARRENLLATDCPHHAAASAGAAPAAVDPLGKTRLHPRLLARIAPAVARSLVEHGVPGWVSLPGVLGFLEGAGFDVRSQAVGPDGRRRFEVAERSSGPGATPRPSEDR